MHRRYSCIIYKLTYLPVRYSSLFNYNQDDSPLKRINVTDADYLSINSDWKQVRASINSCLSAPKPPPPNPKHLTPMDVVVHS